MATPVTGAEPDVQEQFEPDPQFDRGVLLAINDDKYARASELSFLSHAMQTEHKSLYAEIVGFLLDEIYLRETKPLEANPMGPEYLQACYEARGALCGTRFEELGLRLTSEPEPNGRIVFLPYYPYGNPEEFRQICSSPMLINLHGQRSFEDFLAWEEKVEKYSKNLRSYTLQPHVNQLKDYFHQWYREGLDADMQVHTKPSMPADKIQKLNKVAEQAFCRARTAFEILRYLRDGCGPDPMILFPVLINGSMSFADFYRDQLGPARPTWFIERVGRAEPSMGQHPSSVLDHNAF